MEPTIPEPSMEDILASIKRIIAEEPPVADAPKPLKPGRQPIRFDDRDAGAGPEADDASDVGADAASSAGDDEAEAPAEDVLELTSAVDEAPKPPASPAAAPDAAAPTLVSDDAAIASRQALATLSAMVVKPEGGDNTLDGLVREMLRPVLKEWLDARLPDIVERLVALEISRITSRGV